MATRRGHRLRQELVLGIGGVRILRRLGIDPTVFHMNEGHSAFLQLERLRELVADRHVARDAALVERNVGSTVSSCGFTWEEFATLGRVHEGEGGFGLTPFALRTSSHAN